MLLLAVLVSAGCGSRSNQIAQSDRWAAIDGAGIADIDRVRSIEIVWSDIEAGGFPREPGRERLKKVMWNRRMTDRVRIAVIDALASDETSDGRADTRRALFLVLQQERDPRVVQKIADLAVERTWDEFVSPLVRSLARFIRGAPDRDRPEAAALIALGDGRTLEEIVLGVFVDPPGMGRVETIDLRERAQLDAWTLLARLDPDQSQRRRLAGTIPSDVDAMVAGVRDAIEQLRVVPFSGDEIKWIVTMRADEAGRARWDEAARAIAALPVAHTGPIELRHVEAIRWAFEHRRDWTALTTGELHTRLAQRLAGRRVYQRTSDQVQQGMGNHERLAQWTDRLGWGDLLTILVVDEAIHATGVAQRMGQYARLDRADSSTEYGGLLAMSPDGTSFDAQLFPPRPSERLGDDQFIASPDLIARSAWALAHFHFHVQDERQRSYAGPSRNDLIYAARTGRTCVVLTAIEPGELDADVYQPDAVVIDLGPIHP